MEHSTRLLRRCHLGIAATLLALMFILGLSSMVHNSAIVDEVAHIPAAYSYLSYGDYRLNPEHPPLIKDIVAIPLKFMHLTFPHGVNDPWTTEADAQWDTGWQFLYHSGNDTRAILFWARLPILLLSVAFGAFLYLFMRRRFGIPAALLTLFFYALSPNILASSIFVTTDLGASIFMFLALVAYVRFAERPTRKNVLLLGFVLAAAELVKFSAALLYLFLLIMSLIQVFAWNVPDGRVKRLKTYTGGLILASLLSVVIIWLYYIPHTINMPAEVQQRLTDNALSYGPGTLFRGFLDTMSPHPLLKPVAQYLLGLIMVFGRVAGGNTTYFMGQVTNQSFKLYFPVLVMLKTQIALLIIGFGTFALGLVRYVRHRPFAFSQRASSYARRHFAETTLALFALFYFVIAVGGNLNLGVRHILPIYIPLFVLAALAVVRLGRRVAATRRWRAPGVALTTGLLVWYGAATLWVAPSYLSYFNEFIGGPANADGYFSDSSVDWGQDLLRLKDYMAAHHIQKFALDYFGGGEPKYYFSNDPGVVYWHAQNGPYTGQYIAVSETYLENDRYSVLKGQGPGYAYLRAMKPVAQIGYSIYVYKLY